MGLSSPTGESLSSPKLEGKIIYTIEFDEIFVIQSGIAYELVSDDHFFIYFCKFVIFDLFSALTLKYCPEIFFLSLTWT